MRPHGARAKLPDTTTNQQERGHKLFTWFRDRIILVYFDWY